MPGSEPVNLTRFVTAQRTDYARALGEIAQGRKQSHWMWYVFPQFAGLGVSAMSQRFAITSAAEAAAYLAHATLGPRLRECMHALVLLQGRTASDVFGSPDDKKLRSCATLFAHVSPLGSVFHQVLDTYFGGEPDSATLALLGAPHGPLRLGHYWKTPFVWEPGRPQPAHDGALTFEPARDDRLRDAVAEALAASFDESDYVAVCELGASRAADELLALVPSHFAVHHEWWRVARNDDRDAVGFVLPVLFRDSEREGTILYMGVAPAYRGHGHGARLVAEATRILIDAGCTGILCDTGATNTPMLGAFRRCGYAERPPWQRPLR